ncbi:MAG: hypothetical protein AAF085_01325 [Planctomycetota bacterium]
MYLPRLIQTLSAVLVLAAVLMFTAPAQAQLRDRGFDEPIVIRQTIPDPQAVRRGPITSDRLSTTSTRLIDARRGFRPYSSVFGDRASHHRYAAYDDHFGISRPENRPWSYSQRTPRTSVTQFRNTRASSERSFQTPRRSASPQPMTIIVREQLRADTTKTNTTIRIHKDRSATPTTSGAVLVASDGTVIQIGD